MRKHGFCCHTVSVRPSVTLMYYIYTAEDDDILKLLSRPGSPIILAFDDQRRYPIPREPLQRGEQYIHRVGKSLFISETVRDRYMVTMER